MKREGWTIQEMFDVVSLATLEEEDRFQESLELAKIQAKLIAREIGLVLGGKP